MSVEEKLQDFAERKDAELEYVRSQFDEALEMLEGKMTDEQRERGDINLEAQAFNVMVSQYTVQNRVSGSDVTVTAIGCGNVYDFERYEDGQRTGKERPVMSAFGVATNNQGRKQLTYFMLDGDHFHPDYADDPQQDFDDLRELFRAGNVLEGKVRLSEREGIEKFWSANSVENGAFEQVEDDRGREEIRDEIDDYVTEEATLQNVTQYLSDDSEGFMESRSKVYRLRGTVAGHILAEDYSYGAYVVQDQSELDPDDYDSETIKGGRDSAIGFTAWVNDLDTMQYEPPSVLDLYGTFSKNPQNGQVSMNVIGILPLMAFEGDVEPNAGGNGGSTNRAQKADSGRDSDVEEMSI